MRKNYSLEIRTKYRKSKCPKCLHDSIVCMYPFIWWYLFGNLEARLGGSIRRIWLGGFQLIDDTTIGSCFGCKVELDTSFDRYTSFAFRANKYGDHLWCPDQNRPICQLWNLIITRSKQKKKKKRTKNGKERVVTKLNVQRFAYSQQFPIWYPNSEALLNF